MIDRESGRKLKSTTTTLQIVDALVELDGARVSEIAKYLDISKGTACNHLHTLRKQRYVVVKGDEYYPSLKFTYIGEHSRRRNRAYELAAEMTRQLDEQIPFETTFIVEENGVGRYLTPEVAQPGRHDKFAFAGQEEQLHTIAAGKTILAEFPEEKVEKVIRRRGLEEKTDQTITDKEELYTELDRVQEQGYATNQRENRDEIYAIAKAVHKPQGDVFGSMSILTPKFRLKGDDFDEEYYRMLFDQVDELERRIESSLSTL